MNARRPWILGALLLLGCLGQARAEPRYAGRSLEEALLALRAQGLRLVFTSQVVRPEMRVEREPSAGAPRQILAELLPPHGLMARDGPNGVVVVVPRPAAEPTGGTAEGPPPVLEPVPVFREEIVVRPSRLSLLDAQPTGALGLGRDEILALPHLGNDFFRALTLLPGIAGNDITAQFHVRGGRRDEVQILVDGQELFEPFHLRDLDSPLSVIAPATLGDAELSTGAYAARYGDRMSGVLDMTTITPSGPPRLRIGAGILGFQLGGGGGLPGERGHWLVEARHDASSLLTRIVGDRSPDYWDAFGKVDMPLSPSQRLRANALYSGNRLDLTEIRGEESKRYETGFDSRYLWLTHQMIAGSDLFFESAASRARLGRDRHGDEQEEDARFSISDERESEILGLRQAWHFQAAPRHLLEAGWQVRDYTTEYDYAGTRELDSPLARLRHDSPAGSTLFAGRFDERDASVYAADRVTLQERLTLELGLRYDRYSRTGEGLASPRLNLAYAFADRGVLRLAWGRFLQSQRPFELQVEDGETMFHPVERSEHRVIGFEKSFSDAAALRVELYQRRVDHPRPRYENLFEPLNVFQEVEPDRVHVVPERSLAEGVELFLRGRLGRRAEWWINYAYATTEDEIDGRFIPRQFDQTHSVNLDLDLRAGEHWRVNLAWRYHTGWPTTPLSLAEMVDDEGEVEFVPVLGRLNSGHLPGYHRLDVRASRRWELRSFSLDAFVDVQNLYDRQNVAGFDFDIDEEEGTLTFDRETWPGIVPSAGFTLEF